MPYKVKRSGKGFKVTSPNHPQGFSKKPQTAEQARAQQRALYANAGDESSKSGGGGGFSALLSSK